MDPLRARLAALPGGRLKLVIGAAVVAAAVLIGAVVFSAARSSGSTAELPVVRAAATSTPSATPLLVQVTGAVRRPGLVSLPPGARVVDAVAAAGGATAKADEGAVALASRVVDGQQIQLPERGAAPSVAPGLATSAGPATPISLGSATAEQLETLPRIGPAMAARIIAYRQAHGGFASVDDLGKVGGIGPKTLAALRDLVTP